GCDCTNREFDIWLETISLPFMYFLNSPLKRDQAAIKFFVNDIKELIEQIEEKFSVKITPEKISEAIKLTNKIRSVLKEISEFRGKMILKGSEFHALVKKVQQEDKKQMLTLLEKKLEELKTKEPFSDKMKKILLTGSVIDDTDFIKNLETLGFQVVMDDLCIGTRYFWDSIEENGDPIKAISKYHATKLIYSTKIPSLQRFDNLKEFAETYDVDGIINIAQKFCEPILYDHPHISQEFKALEIPYLFVEMEYSRESFKQLSTRFEAFAEMIGGK
ncbi:MAG: 2-hydroxyacyl-CoA dehydratase, partial [archaeon]|nr:2-hydroxyacyl-CoA dehydratase [archaeon]